MRESANESIRLTKRHPFVPRCGALHKDVPMTSVRRSTATASVECLALSGSSAVIERLTAALRDILERCPFLLNKSVWPIRTPEADQPLIKRVKIHVVRRGAGARRVWNTS
jgi:hypothetical protein